MGKRLMSIIFQQINLRLIAKKSRAVRDRLISHAKSAHQ